MYGHDFIVHTYNREKGKKVTTGMKTKTAVAFLPQPSASSWILLVSLSRGVSV